MRANQALADNCPTSLSGVLLRRLSGPAAGVLVEPLVQRRELRANRWQITLDHVPHEIQVYPEVFVNQLVAHPRDLPPRHRWLELARLVRDPLNRLADDLDVADDRVLRLAVRKEPSRPSSV